ncbi:helix-turn-helix domain-containing protein [Streptomyces chattanoogensis]|uniref:DNA-binding protein n=1 Tax=Streptomyces chattanoogensis TaxID=66876 RepID=A0A0N0GYS1_9ACTN|nr:helix-turn-helix transcriptional regulator [Streptomyces chattanoogensis]KPC62102.1 DNA-binding protein [Streptomyces chattanoogensis]
MPVRKEIDGSRSVPAFYGKELRWKREKAGRTLKETVEGSYFGTSYLSEIERGQRRIPETLASHIDRALETDGFFARHCEDVRNAKPSGHADYFAEVAEAAWRARDIEDWDPTLILGPLQLEPYIRAVVHAAHPEDTEEEVASKVAARREYAGRFESTTAPERWVVLHESILKQPIIGDDEMAEQLAHVAALARRRCFVPQILPVKGRAHPFMTGTTRIMTFCDAPPLVYVEGMYSGQTIDDSGIVRRYQKAYDRLRAAALPPEESLAMIEKAAEGYGNGKHPR